MDRQRTHARAAAPRAAAGPVVARGSERQRRVMAEIAPPVPRAARKAGAGAATSEASLDRDSYASTAFAEIVDRSVHAAAARFTAGLSPMALI